MGLGRTEHQAEFFKTVGPNRKASYGGSGGGGEGVCSLTHHEATMTRNLQC